MGTGRVPFQHPYLPGQHSGAHMCPSAIPAPICARATFRCSYVPEHPSGAHMCPGTLPVPICAHVCRHVKMAVASVPPTGGWVTSQQPPTGSISRKKPFQGSTRRRAVSVKLLNFNSRGMWTSGGLSKRQVIGRLAGERGVDCCVLTETKTGTLGEWGWEEGYYWLSSDADVSSGVTVGMNKKMFTLWKSGGARWVSADKRSCRWILVC